MTAEGKTKKDQPQEPEPVHSESVTGRELDAAVCEALGATDRIVVYEWADRKKHEHPIIAFSTVPWDDWNGPTRRMFGTLVGEDGERLTIRPHEPQRLSVLIQYAWTVVTQMGERGFHAVVKSPFMPGEQYHAGFTPHGATGWNGRADYRGSGDTAPLAICRATLLAAESR